MGITAIKYYRDGIFRMETLDPIYGSPKYSSAPRSPFRLVLPKPDGGFFTQNEAFVELKKSIYGPNGNQPFAETLPKLTPAVDEYITSLDAQYPWNPFDPNDTSTWPTTLPDNGRGWECESADSDPDSHLYLQNMQLSSIPLWGALNIFQYRKQKLYYREAISVYNDQFPIIEAQRAAELALYEQILKDTFVLKANYVFPSLQTNQTVIPMQIANTALQIKLWNKTHALIPDPNWIPPTQEELLRYRESGLKPPTVPLVTSWTEANRWTPETIPAGLLNKWEIFEDGVWKKIAVDPDYWLASTTGSWIQKQAAVPNSENNSQWDAKVSATILITPPKYTYDFKLKQLLSL